MGGGWSLLETTRRWRDSVHARCTRVALEFSAVAYPAGCGAESHAAPRGRPKPAAHFCQVQLRAAQIRIGGTNGRSGDVKAEVRVCRRNGHAATSHDAGRAVESVPAPARRDHRTLSAAGDHIARRFSNRGEPLEDLVQVALMGLIQAVNRYDTENGADFLAFAVPTVMGEVRRYFRDHGWSVKVPRRMEELGPQLIRATRSFSTVGTCAHGQRDRRPIGNRPGRGGALREQAQTPIPV